MKAKSILFTALLIITIGIDVLAQAPQGFTYQAIARDGQSVLNDQTIDVRFTILQGGNQVYQETHSLQTNKFGLFTATVGDGLTISGIFENIPWETGNFFLKVEIDPNQSGFVNMGTTQMQSVPFSLYANKAGGVENVNLDDLEDVIAPLPDPGDVLKWDGTQWVSSPDEGGNIFAGAGINIINDTIINAGDPDPNDDIVIGSLAGGDLAGTYPNPTVVKIRGLDVSSNTPVHGEILKWNGTSMVWEPSSDNVTSGSGGGVNTTARISGDGAAVPLDIAQQNAGLGQILKWNGTSWSPADDGGTQSLSLAGTILSLSPGGGSVNLPFTSYTGGPGINIAGNIISNTGDTTASDDITIGYPASGDLTGLYPSPTVARIRNVPVLTTPPSAGNVLKFNNGAWAPSTDAVNDPDSDPNNEIQTLSLSNGQITLSNGGGTVTLPTYIGGLGIDITGPVISNTGDTNPADDITIGSAAGGDLTGTYPNPSVVKIHGRTVSSNAPNAGYVYKWDQTNSQWLAQPDDDTDADADPTNELQSLSVSGNTLMLSGGGGSAALPVYTGGAGITVSGTTIINTGDLNPLDDITTSTSAGGDLTGFYPNPTVSALAGKPLANISPNSGQVLKWSGSQWVPSVDEVNDGDINPANELQSISLSGNTLSLSMGGGSVNLPVYTAGSGINISSNQITNTGDINPFDDITIGTTAGGDLNGTYPNPNVVKIQGKDVSNLSPNPGEIFKWNGSQWAPGQDLINDADANSTNEIQTLSLSGNTLSLSLGGGSVSIPVYTGGPGINVSGTTIINTGDLNGSDDVLIGSAAGGDLNGTYPNPGVAKIQGREVASAMPSNGQVLKWNGMQWAPGADLVNDGDTNSSNEIQGLSLSGTTISLSNGGGSVVLPYSAGTGISLNGAIINNTGDTDASDDITTSTTAGGDLDGLYPDPQVVKLQGFDLSSNAPTLNQVLKWDGSKWLPQTDEFNDPDNNPTNEIQQLTLTGTTLSLSQGGGSVAIPVYTAGNGINITNNVVTNTGDLDPSNDITINTAALGDVSGNFPILTVTRIQGSPVSNASASSGQVLEWNGTQWAPATDDNTTYTAGPGITISGVNNLITNTGDLDGSDDVNLTTSAGGDVSGVFTNLTVEGIQGETVSSATPSANQVLKYVGGTWTPASDDNTTYTAGSGLALTGTVFSNTGDTNASDDITTSTIAGGDLDGQYPNPTVVSLQGNPVSPIPGGSIAVGQVLEWDGTQWAPAADDGVVYSGGTGINITGSVVTNTGDTDASDDITTSSVAGGDVGGNFANLTVTGLQNNPIANIAPATNEVLKWNGTNWVPGPDIGIVYTGGIGINVSGNSITNTGDTDPSNDITNTTSAGGDLSGLYPNPTVTRIQGSPVSSSVPSLGQSLKWDGLQWTPSPDDNTTYTAGTGLNLSGNVFSNTGDTDASDDITTSTLGAGDVSGNFPTLTVTGLRGTPLSVIPPTTGQVLKWDGSQWEGAADENTTYTAGAGLTLSGTTFINTGDTDGSDDITTASTAGGDVSGPFSNLSVDFIKGNPVSATTPANGEVLKWNGAQWLPSSDNNTAYTAGTGINITGTTINNTGDTDPSNDITNTTSATGDLSGTYPAPVVAGIQGNPVAGVAPGIGQILKWNGSQWFPSSDDGTNYTAGTGINITGTTINNTGDTDPSNDITNTTLGLGDVTGLFPTLTVTGIQGKPVSVGTPSNGQILKWDGIQWSPASDANDTYTAGTGLSLIGNVFANTGDTDGSDDITIGSSAGGDLSGTYPNPEVDGLQGNPVSAAAPANGEVLKWNGTEWAPASDDGTIYTGGTGIGITGTVITNLGDTDASDDITTSTLGAGDVSGFFPNLTVTSIQGNSISAIAPVNGQILKWNGTQWDLSSDDNNTYTAGAGLSLTGNVFANTGDTDGSDDVNIGSSAGGDLAGTYPNPQVDGLQGNPVSSNAPVNGEVLKWNGTEWAPGSDDGTTYTGGTGIGITGTVITNLGDTDPGDDITNTTSAGGDLNGTYPNPTVDGLQGNPVSSTAPTVTGQVLEWSGTEWVPGTDDNTTYTAGTGLSLTGTVFANTGDTDASDDVTISSLAGGDATGNFSALTVTGIQGNPVSSLAPTSAGQILKWDGFQWTVGTDNGANYVAGSGIGISGNIISNLGDADGSDDITNTTTAGGDLSGTYPNPTVDGLQGSPVSAVAPTSVGQVLKWDGGQWAPGTDAGTTYTGGAGINVTGTVISNTGDLDGSDDITNISVAGGDVSGVFSNLTVTDLQNVPVSSSAPTVIGQVLKWNGASWAPGTDDGANYTGGTGISIAGTVINNTGDTDPSNDITNTTIAGGDLGGVYPNPTVDGLQGNPVSNSIPVSGQVLKWNGLQWTPSADNNDTYTAGAGISIVGNVINNLGDPDASNDITNTTSAGGDLNGTYPNPTVDGLQGNPVSLTAPTIIGQVLAWDGTQWGPGTDNVNDLDADPTNEIQTLSVSGSSLTLSNGGGTVPYPPTYTAGAGIALSGTTIINIGDTDASNDITNTTSAGGDLNGTYPNPTVDGLQGNPVSSTAPTVVGQVLEWDGTQWAPGTDDGVLYGAGTGINISGNIISNTGDTSNTNEIQTLSISGTTISLSNGGSSVALPYTAGPGIGISGVFISNTGDTDAADDITNTTVANGDLSGTYPNPTVDGLQGNPVSATAPTIVGQVLQWDGASWTPGKDSVNDYTAGAGISIAGNVVTNIGDNDSTDDITNTTPAGGDLGGTYPNPTVAAIQGTGVSSTAPSVAGQVLKFNGTEWTPADDSVTTFTAGAGIDITGNVFSNIGDTDSTNDITNTTAAGGDLSGIYPNPTVAGLQGTSVSSTNPTVAGQVLKFNGTEWAPGSDSVNVYTAGAGIDITGNVVANIGDTDSTNDITNTTAAGGDLSGIYPNPTVAGIQGVAVSSATPQNAEYLRYNGSTWVSDSIFTSDIKVNGDLLPLDNTYNLGGAANRWVEVFAFNGTINTSDIREKKDITDIHYGLDEIMKLRPVSFNWIKRPELGTKLGLIAQEVKPVVSEVVKTEQIVLNPETGKMETVEMDRFGINYTDLIPVIVKGMQEQQEIVNSQNNLIEKQQSAIEKLEARIKQLEEKLK